MNLRDARKDWKDIGNHTHSKEKEKNDFNKNKRVGIISKIDHKKKIISFLGYGELIDDLSLNDNQLNIDLHKKDKKDNIKIKLENGDFITLKTFWWGKEKDIEKKLYIFEVLGYKIKIKDLRENLSSL